MEHFDVFRWIADKKGHTFLGGVQVVLYRSRLFQWMEFALLALLVQRGL